MVKVTFIYCFRDRELVRVRQSLDSLAAQTNKSFKVIFVDFGSQKDHAREIEKLVAVYPFVNYVYNDTRGMVWNRSHALNTAIRMADTEYVFTSDIDMIYKPGFVEMLYSIISPDKAFFFSAILLPSEALPGNESKERKYERSAGHALGWGLIPLQRLLDIGSYDEVYCIWGKEDNDIEYRLRLTGTKVEFITEIWMYHFYHPPVPQQRAILPEDWFLFLKNYFDSARHVAIRNSEIEWGRIFPKSSRKAHQLIEQPGTPYRLIDGRSRFFRYTLEKSFDKAKSGDALKFLFHDKVAVKFTNSTISSILHLINKVFLFLHLPVQIKSIYEVNYEDIYTARNEFLYFLISRINTIVDYAFEINKDTIRVIVIKK